MKEIEKRVFLSEQQYQKFLFAFNLVNKTPERQITTYFDANGNDLRLMNTQSYSKIWLKGGVIHDNCREEYEVIFNNKYLSDMSKILSKLFNIKTKWFRERFTLSYKKANLCLDKSLNYGAILELEILTENESFTTHNLDLINQYLEELGLVETPKDYANEKFIRYVNEWTTFDFPKDEKLWLEFGEGN